MKSCATKRDSRYQPEAYWTSRLGHYGFDIRGVGNASLSVEENWSLYQHAQATVLLACNGLAFDSARVLDIGCGMGMYTRFCHDQGNRQYTGIDITDVLFRGLRLAFPDYEFLKMDITQTRPDGEYDLIFMLDVSQHIVDDDKLCQAMSNVKEVLAGRLLISSWLTPEREQRSHYEACRPLSFYQSLFKDYKMSQLAYRDKYLLVIERSST